MGESPRELRNRGVHEILGVLRDINIYNRDNIDAKMLNMDALVLECIMRYHVSGNTAKEWIMEAKRLNVDFEKQIEEVEKKIRAGRVDDMLNEDEKKVIEKAVNGE
jgi:hypothetical protein